MRGVFISWGDEKKYRIVVDADIKRTNFFIEQYMYDADDDPNVLTRKQVWCVVDHEQINDIIGNMPVSVVSEALALISLFVNEHYIII